MNKKILIVTMLFISLILIAQRDALAEKEIILKSDKDKLSYIIGTDMAQLLEEIKDEINFDQLMLGIKDNYAGNKSLVPADEASTIMQDFSVKMREKMTQQAKIDLEKNTIEGESFLKENKEKENVITTASGLQYIVLKEGDGPIPTLNDQVVVHYKGTTIDGVEFDSSYKRGQPATFPLAGVIKGWTEALQLMKVNSTYKLFIPSALAYGERGSPPNIGPNSVLIFDVELIEIK